MKGVSPPGRALALLAVLSIVAIVVLGWMAERYAKLVPDERKPDETAARSAALRDVDAYLLVRERLRTLPVEDRASAFAGSGLTETEFERTNAALIAWRAGTLPELDPRAAAFDRRRDRLGLQSPAER